MSTIGVDLDGTLVSWSTREFEPGALQALRKLSAAGHIIILHTCRTQVPGGMAEIEELLGHHTMKGINIAVWTGEGKPGCSAYIDDRAVEYRGDWRKVVREVEWLIENRPEESDQSERPRT
jgi:hypothetical protein